MTTPVVRLAALAAILAVFSACSPSSDSPKLWTIRQAMSQQDVYYHSADAPRVHQGVVEFFDTESGSYLTLTGTIAIYPP